MTTPPPPTGPVPPPPPPPTNASLVGALLSQLFPGDGASGRAILAPLSAVPSAVTPAALSNVTVRFDAATNSYTVSAAGRSQTFGPTHRDPGSTAALQSYTRDEGTTSDLLLMSRAGGYDATSTNTYVAHGLWLRLGTADVSAPISYDSFVYGVETPAAGVPRSGEAAYETEIHGMLTMPGQSLHLLSGYGGLVIDFQTGHFVYEAYPAQTAIDTGVGSSGGSMRLRGGGVLDSSSNGFTGQISYEYSTGATQTTSVFGSMKGRLYGPGAAEAGGVFSANSPTGASLTGSFAGGRSTATALSNPTLTRIIGRELFFSSGTDFSTARDSSGNILGGYGSRSGAQITLQPGSFTLVPGVESLYSTAPYTAAEIVAAPDRPNFTTYARTFEGVDLRVSQYKIGPANTELALTYSSFALFEQRNHRLYLAYGLMTPAPVLDNRTGSARYNGVVYGTATTHGAAAARYTLSGQATYDVNFSAHAMTGNLTLTGVRDGTGETRTFDPFTLESPVGHQGNFGSTGNIYRNGQGVGTLENTKFYGPDAQEVSSGFTIVTDNLQPNQVSMGGLIIGKRE